jgi:hypothetical protein
MIPIKIKDKMKEKATNVIGGLNNPRETDLSDSNTRKSARG